MYHIIVLRIIIHAFSNIREGGVICMIDITLS